eukprot:6185870-Pleurochrysis_carterae.AAC.2
MLAAACAGAARGQRGGKASEQVWRAASGGVPCPRRVPKGAGLGGAAPGRTSCLLGLRPRPLGCPLPRCGAPRLTWMP